MLTLLRVLTQKQHWENLLYEGTEHKKDAGEHPSLEGSQPLCLWCVGGDAIEDVDQDQEDCD